MLHQRRQVFHLGAHHESWPHGVLLLILFPFPQGQCLCCDHIVFLDSKVLLSLSLVQVVRCLPFLLSAMELWVSVSQSVIVARVSFMGTGLSCLSLHHCLPLVLKNVKCVSERVRGVCGLPDAWPGVEWQRRLGAGKIIRVHAGAQGENQAPGTRCRPAACRVAHVAWKPV